MRVRRSPRAGLAFARLAFLASHRPASATWQDDIGYNYLKSLLGASLPNGAGTSVSQIEAPVDLNNTYLPSADPNPTTGNYAGKEFHFNSGAAAQSWHANTVATCFYGLFTDAAISTYCSVAPQAGNGPLTYIDCYEAGNWLDVPFMNVDQTATPFHETNAVTNHSWIADPDPATFPLALVNDSMRRIDYSIDTDDYLCVVGMTNYSVSAVPHLLASCYNVLAIGLSNGEHGTGTTPADIDGGGRAKPDLTMPAPLFRTSYATGAASSCTAFLWSAANATPALNAATTSEVLRALLYCGATKNHLTAKNATSGLYEPYTWSHTVTRPFDVHYGTGEINLARSYRALTAGKQSPNSTIGLRGWDYDPTVLATGASRSYTLVIPSGCIGSEVSIALVWNRRMTGTNGAKTQFTTGPTPRLPDLSLTLTNGASTVAESRSGDSGSPPTTVEYLYVRDLAAGSYTLTVSNAASGSFSTDYGLAWHVVPSGEQAPEMSLTASGTTGTLHFANLCAEAVYAVEKSTDLAQWTALGFVTVPANTTTGTFTTALDSGSVRTFYRLRNAGY